MDEGDFEEELEVLRELENGGGDMQATQQSDGDLFRSRPSRGGTSALFFEDDSGDEGDRGPAPHGAMDGLVSEGHRMRSDFQSSPPTFTSPSFRADQPMPIPSDWSIPVSLSQSLPTAANRESLIRASSVHDVDVSMTFVDNEADSQSARLLESNHDAEMGACSKRIRLGVGQHADAAASSRLHRHLLDPYMDDFDDLEAQFRAEAAEAQAEAEAAEYAQDPHAPVLTWVKQWDYCVFKKPVKRTFEAFNQSRFRKKLLFEGAKTTLAHVVARHAGYNVVEINASDDRTGEALKNKLLGAIECQPVMGGKLPNLVIIDEIDGASSGGGDQGDMRSSMNTLQFMHGKTGHLTKEMLLDFDVGNKDFARSLFQVWQTLFSAPLSKDLKRLEFHVRGANSKSSLREVGTDRFVERIVPILEHTGEYSKILQGCFENYLKSHRVETMWSKAADSPRFNQTFNALHLCDAIERSIMRHQHFELMAYQPYAIREAAGVMRTFAHGVVAHARMAWPSQLPMRLELVPFLLLALSPNFRPLIKPAERAELDRLVTLMLAFGLHFAPQKDAGHQQSYELDPPIHALLLQSKLERTINDASSAIKSLVAQEPARDFFGRPIAAPERKEDQASSAPGLEDKGRRLRSKVRVVFKFNEGFSNAVRTPCYMRDFL
nr:hypothetical protein HK105_001378 [Polyrhizophydium stewartii]